MDAPGRLLTAERVLARQQRDIRPAVDAHRAQQIVLVLCHAHSALASAIPRHVLIGMCLLVSVATIVAVVVVVVPVTAAAADAAAVKGVRCRGVVDRVGPRTLGTGAAPVGCRWRCCCCRRRCRVIVRPARSQQLREGGGWGRLGQLWQHLHAQQGQAATEMRRWAGMRP